MALGGDGCYFAQYGCPKHGIHRVGFIRDVWAEAHQNAANDEQDLFAKTFSNYFKIVNVSMIAAFLQC
jgi:hypothetical protein